MCKRLFVLFFAVLFLLCFQASTVFSGDREVEKQPLTLEKVFGKIMVTEVMYRDPGWHMAKTGFHNNDESCARCHTNIVPKIRLPVATS